MNESEVLATSSNTTDDNWEWEIENYSMKIKRKNNSTSFSIR